MSDISELKEKLLNNFIGPKRVRTDGAEVEQQDIDKQIQALEKLEQLEAKDAGRYKMRTVKMSAGGAVD